MQITDSQLTDLAEEMIANSIRDLMHDRMGQCEQLGDVFEGFGELDEAQQDAICERLEATLQPYLDALLTKVSAEALDGEENDDAGQ